MSNTFSKFQPRLQEAIATRLGWTSLRPVQEQAGAAILDGKNAVVLAPTAGGKTEASIFPVLSSLMEREPDGVGTLYVAPIKALLNNQEERLGTYTEMVGLRRFVWHGDAKQSDKQKFTREPGALLMLTPESLEVMLLSSRVPAPKLFRDLRAVIIDEVHAFAGTDRGAHLMSVLERVARFTKNDIQRIGLSATVGNPEAILQWITGSSAREGVVIDPPKPAAKRTLMVTLSDTTATIVRRAAATAVGKKSLFFCQSRAVTEAVAEGMRGRDIDVFAHHSSVSLEERQAAEARFNRGTNACIACTSTLELGIDVGDLDLVFQVNATSTVSSFLQRMGRTGRREGTSANTTFFCEEPQAVLQAIALIELAREHWVESIPDQTRCWPVLVHQLLALTLQFGAITREDAWNQVSRVPDFKGISSPEYNALLEHLLAHDYLFETSGALSMGDAAEKAFGRKNFMELYAVFSSPVHYKVQTISGRDIGSLDQDYVDRLVEKMTSFLLGGRAWNVDYIQHSDRTIKVKPAPRGQKPSWGGYVPQHLSRELCQRIRKIITNDAETYPYVDSNAQPGINDVREDLGPLLRETHPPIQDDEGQRLRWWTFEGGRINHTLKHAIEWLEPAFTVVADNFMLRIEGPGITYASIHLLIQRMSEPGFWDSTETRTALLNRLPNYRLSKFQAALPSWAAAEMVGAYLLDFEGARECVRGAV